MKKISFAIILFISAVYVTACDRNDLYLFKDDPAQALMFLINSKNNNPSPPPATIYMYNAGEHAGALGGRNGADALCAAGAPPGTTIYHAFLSVTASDQVRYLLPYPWRNLSIPIYGAGANVIANSWADLWDGSIVMALQDALVLPGGSQWWSGSRSDGSFDTASTPSLRSCSSWSTSASGTGVIGLSIYGNDPAWVSAANQGCSASCYVICIAY